MELDKLLVTMSGLGFIAFIYWFFFAKKDETASTSNNSGSLNITVDGGYMPSVVKLIKGKEASLKITRKDSNSCLEEIILPDFKIKKYLPLNQEVEIKFTPQKSGEFPFHCGMNMFHGKLVVD